MATNDIITAVGLTREELRVLVNNLKFTMNCYKGYNANNFGNASPKEGTVLHVRIPNEYKSHVGSTMVLQDVKELTVPIELTTQRHIAFSASTVEYTTDIDNFSRMFLSPMMVQMANDIDFDGTDLYKKVYNQIGSAGVTPASVAIYLDAGVVLDNNSVPRDNRRVALLNPIAQAAVVENLSGLFNPSNDISRQNRQGQMGDALGFSFEMDQNLKIHNTGNFGTAADLAADMVEGSNVISLTNFSDLVGDPTLEVGDIFTVAGVNSVNWRNKQDTSRLQQFVVESAVWSDPNLVVTVAPAAYASQINPLQNVTALGASGAEVLFAGDQNSDYQINLIFHTDAFVFVSASLFMDSGLPFAARESVDGISIKTVRDYDITEDKLPCRSDVLYGFACPRPQLACRVMG